MMTHDNSAEPNSEKQSPWRLCGVRLAAVILGLLLWHLTQSMVDQRAEVRGIADNTIVDQAHVLTSSWNIYLIENKTEANVLLIISTSLIDLVACTFHWRQNYTTVRRAVHSLYCESDQPIFLRLAVAR